MNDTNKFQQHLKRRQGAEKRFRLFGLSAIVLVITMLVVLLYDIISTGYTAMVHTHIQITVQSGAEGRQTVLQSLQREFPEATDRRSKKALRGLVSSMAYGQVEEKLKDYPNGVTLWVPADDTVDMLYKGRVNRDAPEGERPLNDQQIAWLDTLDAQGRIKKFFNWPFLTHGDSREPEQAGIGGSLMGSLLTMLVTLLLSLPVGVGAAVYLEEFAGKNRWTRFLEANINNLAAVPSIVFGLLGLAIFINFFGLPRSAPLVGGMVLSLMTLPTIIIASRAALRSVPASIRSAALGLGASPVQVVLHHVLPLALPGILTGTIIGMAQALGETAPLLMIGMVAFIVDIPSHFTDAATVLPVQVFLWSDMPERAFVEKAAAASMMLLVFLLFMNLLAIILRRRFERTW